MSLPDRLVDLDEEYADTLYGAAREELIWLWADLADARRTALRGCWSIECASLTVRIVALTRHAGAVGWDMVDTELVRSGLYERIHREAGLTYPPVDWDAVTAHERHLADMSPERTSFVTIERPDRPEAHPTSASLPYPAIDKHD